MLHKCKLAGKTIGCFKTLDRAERFQKEYYELFNIKLTIIKKEK